MSKPNVFVVNLSPSVVDGKTLDNNGRRRYEVRDMSGELIGSRLLPAMGRFEGNYRPATLGTAYFAEDGTLDVGAFAGKRDCRDDDLPGVSLLLRHRLRVEHLLDPDRPVAELCAARTPIRDAAT